MKKLFKFILIFLGSILGSMMLYVIIYTGFFLADTGIEFFSSDKSDEVTEISTCPACECEEQDTTEEDSENVDEELNSESNNEKVVTSYHEVLVDSDSYIKVFEINEEGRNMLGERFIDIDSYDNVIVNKIVNFESSGILVFVLSPTPTGCVHYGDNQEDFDSCVESLGKIYKDYQKVGSIWTYDISGGTFKHLVRVPMTESISDFRVVDLKSIENTSYFYYLAEYTDSENGNCEQDYLLNIENDKSFNVSLNCFAKDLGEDI